MPDWRVSFPKPCDERWEGMQPAGGNRFCDRCARTVHDLDRLTIDEAAALMRRDPDACVRARIAPDGDVALKGSGKRRMVATIAATVGLAVAAAPASANDKPPPGTIEGRVHDGVADGRTTVTATDAAGNRYVAKVHGSGRYRIKRLPAGTYTLRFHPECGDDWVLGTTVTVGSARVTAQDTRSRGGCIIVGKLEGSTDFA